jgi:uncharacterized membrane-anchored protein
MVCQVGDDRLRRFVAQRDVEQNVAESRSGTARAKVADEQTDALIARLGETEPAGDRSEPAVDLRDGLLSVVEPADGGDEPDVEAWSSLPHGYRVPAEP